MSRLHPFLATIPMLVALAAAPARADEAPAPPPSPTPAPPPYSLPWQLRPAAAVDVVRIDSAEAFWKDGDRPAFTDATMILLGKKITPSLGLLMRAGFVVNKPGAGDATGIVINPLFAGTYVLPLPRGMRLAFFLGLAAPAGMGGGNNPDRASAAALRAGIAARSSLDNAMFAVNDVVLVPGVDFAWLWKGLTVQVEATLLQLFRVAGERSQPDALRTNFTSGLHVGYFIIPQLSVGAELRYQRWLSDPVAVVKDATGATRDQLSVAAGVRGHFKAGAVTLRPGLAYIRGLDDPMAAKDYHVVQVDVPIVF